MKRIGIAFIAMFLACVGAFAGSSWTKKFLTMIPSTRWRRAMDIGCFTKCPGCVPLILTRDISGAGSITSKANEQLILQPAYVGACKGI